MTHSVNTNRPQSQPRCRWHSLEKCRNWKKRRHVIIITCLCFLQFRHFYKECHLHRGRICVQCNDAFVRSVVRHRATKTSSFDQFPQSQINFFLIRQSWRIGTNKRCFLATNFQTKPLVPPFDLCLLKWTCN